MKPGDLIRTVGWDGGSTRWLYGGDEKCWDDRNSLLPADVPFKFGDVGLILKKNKMVRGRYTQSYVKILTPRGIGWVFENWIDVVI